uniref:Protein kinase domain-containing protein n=1 Tax=Plectus sambesii TaxID=2011161 RepID=A0A914WI19_9BILA
MEGAGSFVRAGSGCPGAAIDCNLVTNSPLPGVARTGQTARSLVDASTPLAGRARKEKWANVLEDFYKLTDDVLGTGAYASVRTGVAIASGSEYAIKLIDKRSHERSRIMREIETFQICKNHPNVVQLHDWFEDNNYFYLVFEKMRGGPLLNHIQRKVYFTEQEASMVTKDIVTALKFLHDKGIAHRDVKPENILCTEPTHVSPVKLCDLDLASKVSLPPVMSIPELASPVGSAEFMAPEVVDAFVGESLKYDKRCDMWSVGVILYIMLCGYPPFYGECWRQNCGWDQGEPCSDCQENLFARIQLGEFDFPEEEWSRVSDDAKDLICRLLVKDVRVRFTADDVLRHPWIRNDAPKTPLQTPDILFRNDSARDLHQMQENFNALNRMAVVGRLSNRMMPVARLSKDSKLKNVFVQPAPVRKPSAPALMLSHNHVHGPNTVVVPAAVNNNTQQLETCQTAMARQDSTNELHHIQSREAKVHV